VIKEYIQYKHLTAFNNQKPHAYNEYGKQLQQQTVTDVNG